MVPKKQKSTNKKDQMPSSKKSPSLKFEGSMMKANEYGRGKQPKIGKK